MPLGIGGLTSLQTLPKVIIAGADGFNISELKGLSNLQGKLSIRGLDKVTDPIHAKEANLHKNKGLEILKMKWSSVFDDSRNETIEYQVLEGLKPHPKLRSLEISFYKGTRFPSWVGDPSFDRLTKLTLSGCKSTHLPTLGSLQSLKTLFLKNMKEVKTVGFKLLPSLEVLKFDNMQEWERWSTSGGDDNGTTTSFPRLREISILFCPKLGQVSIGLIPSLQVLHINDCSEAGLTGIVGVSSSLKEVSIYNCERFRSYNCSNSVERLVICRCDSMTSLTFSTPLSLRSLRIRSCKNLESFPLKHVLSLTSLKEMVIERCPMMESFPCGLWPPNLTTLRIGELKKPMSEWGQQNYPTSLVDLVLKGKNSGVVSFAVAENGRTTTASASSSFLLPSSLSSLSLISFEDVKSLSDVLKHLPSLKHLDIYECPKLDNVRETTYIPSSLTVNVNGIKRMMRFL